MRGMWRLVFFMESAVGMWQQVSENMRDNPQIGRHLIAGECFHACTGIKKEKENFQIK
jgi:hypothetical protein